MKNYYFRKIFFKTWP